MILVGFVSYNLQLVADLYQVRRGLESLVECLHQGVDTAGQFIIDQTGQAGLELRAEFLCWEREDLRLEVGRDTKAQVVLGSRLVGRGRFWVRPLQVSIDLSQVEQRGISGQHWVVVSHTAAQSRTLNLKRWGELRRPSESWRKVVTRIARAPPYPVVSVSLPNIPSHWATLRPVMAGLAVRMFPPSRINRPGQIQVRSGLTLNLSSPWPKYKWRGKRRVNYFDFEGKKYETWYLTLVKICRLLWFVKDSGVLYFPRKTLEAMYPRMWLFSLMLSTFDTAASRIFPGNLVYWDSEEILSTYSEVTEMRWHKWVLNPPNWGQK